VKFVKVYARVIGLLRPDRGIAIGLDHFGTSAPAAAIAAEFGFTPEAVARVAAGLLTKA